MHNADQLCRGHGCVAGCSESGSGGPKDSETRENSRNRGFAGSTHDISFDYATVIFDYATVIAN
jgi:hypothetical protein